MMKTSKIMKILAIMMVMAMIVISLQPIVSATDATQIINNVSDAVNKANNVNINGVTTSAGKVIRLMRNIAVIAAVILLTVLGIKYMMGSVEEKAEYKKSLMPLVIGIVVVVAATQIATMLFSIF